MVVFLSDFPIRLYEKNVIPIVILIQVILKNKNYDFNYDIEVLKK